MSPKAPLLAVLLGLLAMALLPSSAGALFTQCPPVVKDRGCQFLVVVSDGGAQVVQDPTQGSYDPGEDDALIAVQNNSSKPISSIALFAETSFFGFENDGICNTHGEPLPSGCVMLPKTSSGAPTPSPGAPCPPQKEACGFPGPAGEPADVRFPAGIAINGFNAKGDAVTGYEGPTSWFTNISPDAREGVVNFAPPIAQGSSAYFALESPPRGEVPTVLAPTSTTSLLNGGGLTGASITVPSGTPVFDTAQITGTAAASATGTVAYAVYKDSKCTVPLASAGTVAVTGGVAARSAAITPPPGTYYWQASYSGDGANAPSASVCGREVLSVAKRAALLPSTQICLSKRRFVAHPHDPPHVHLVKVRVLINGKLRLSGRLLRGGTTIDLRGLPKGTIHVAMIATSSRGKLYEDVRTYHTCVPGHHPKKKG